MNVQRTLHILTAVGAMVGLLACGGGGGNSGGGPGPGPGPAASTEFNPFVLSTLAGSENSEPTEVNDLTFEYSDDDEAAFAEVVAE